jgi:four helix bundle protein
MINNNEKVIKNVRDLSVYNLAFDAAMEVFNVTRSFPKEEKFSLTDQIRRSSRSVCSNLSEGWHKRQYMPAFRSKLADSMQEASETQTWLDFSLALGYLRVEDYDKFYEQYEHIIAQLLTMERKADSFCRKR